jgi:hypothetical protein
MKKKSCVPDSRPNAHSTVHPYKEGEIEKGLKMFDPTFSNTSICSNAQYT